MAKQNQHELPADLARGRDRLAAWRATKKPRSRIPEALWEMAVKLAAKHGVHRTARTLKLDYYSLKKRTLAAATRRETQDEIRAEMKRGFVCRVVGRFRPGCRVRDRVGGQCRKLAGPSERLSRRRHRGHRTQFARL